MIRDHNGWDESVQLQGESGCTEWVPVEPEPCYWFELDFILFVAQPLSACLGSFSPPLLPGADPREQHSLLSSLSARLLPLLYFLFSSSLLRSLVLGHFILSADPTAGFSSSVASVTQEGCFALIY